MAKMFYSLDEAAQRLQKSPDDVRAMAKRGEITEFRDGDRLIFKVDQIDLLAGDEEHESDMSSMIPLADSGASGSAIGLTDSGVGAGEAKQRSGISVFDADELEHADPSAQTQMSGDLDTVKLESFGSGSGLMDLARASDDTSLGAEGLLDDLYPAGEEPGETATSTSGLFEGAASGGEMGDPNALAGAGAGGVVVLPEAYDGKGSGLTGGLAVGAALALAFALAVVLMDLFGSAPGFVSTLFDGQVFILTGILLGVTIVFGVIGFLVAPKR